MKNDCYEKAGDLAEIVAKIPASIDSSGVNIVIITLTARMPCRLGAKTLA